MNLLPSQLPNNMIKLTNWSNVSTNNFKFEMGMKIVRSIGFNASWITWNPFMQYAQFTMDPQGLSPENAPIFNEGPSGYQSQNPGSNVVDFVRDPLRREL